LTAWPTLCAALPAVSAALPAVCLTVSAGPLPDAFDAAFLGVVRAFVADVRARVAFGRALVLARPLDLPVAGLVALPFEALEPFEVERLVDARFAPLEEEPDRLFVVLCGLVAAIFASSP